MARRRMRFGSAFAWLRGPGPKAMPPPMRMELRLAPLRAVPWPFWRRSLAVEPRTSPRLFVLCVPARALARWAT